MSELKSEALRSVARSTVASISPSLRRRLSAFPVKVVLATVLVYSRGILETINAKFVFEKSGKTSQLFSHVVNNKQLEKWMALESEKSRTTVIDCLFTTTLYSKLKKTCMTMKILLQCIVWCWLGMLGRENPAFYYGWLSTNLEEIYKPLLVIK